jgi:hypothetical protein
LALAGKSSWDQAKRRQNLVGFGEIERKLAKLSMTIHLLTILPLNYFMVVGHDRKVYILPQKVGGSGSWLLLE